MSSSTWDATLQVLEIVVSRPNAYDKYYGDITLA